MGLDIRVGQLELAKDESKNPKKRKKKRLMQLKTDSTMAHKITAQSAFRCIVAELNATRSTCDSSNVGHLD